MSKRFTGLLVPVLALPMGPSFSVQAGEGTPGRPERDASSAAGRARAGAVNATGIAYKRLLSDPDEGIQILYQDELEEEGQDI